jgi:hypothetical protein
MELDDIPSFGLISHGCHYYSTIAQCSSVNRLLRCATALTTQHIITTDTEDPSETPVPTNYTSYLRIAVTPQSCSLEVYDSNLVQDPDWDVLFFSLSLYPFQFIYPSISTLCSPYWKLQKITSALLVRISDVQNIMCVTGNGWLVLWSSRDFLWLAGVSTSPF